MLAKSRLHLSGCSNNRGFIRIFGVFQEEQSRSPFPQERSGVRPFSKPAAGQEKKVLVDSKFGSNLKLARPSSRAQWIFLKTKQSPLVVRRDRPVRADYRSAAPAGGKRERSPCSRESLPPVRSGSSTSSRSFTPDRDKDAPEPPPQKICECGVVTDNDVTSGLQNFDLSCSEI